MVDIHRRRLKCWKIRRRGSSQSVRQVRFWTWYTLFQPKSFPEVNVIFFSSRTLFISDFIVSQY